jgi:DMSO/TMAO reductase YedYZ molybdopterin-dependent catalytic subunit
VAGLLRWEDLGSYLTPPGRHFTVVHYGQPEVDPQAWRLEVGGLVQRPLSLTLEELRARPRQEVLFTLECSGNHGFPWSGGLIGTARWAGTPLAPLLAEAGILATGREVVFRGADAGEETVRGVAMPQHFARSMSLADATDANLLLAYEMNGAPLPAAHGAPCA